MTHRYGDLLHVCPTAKDAVVAAVSHPKYKTIQNTEYTNTEKNNR